MSEIEELRAEVDDWKRRYAQLLKAYQVLTDNLQAINSLYSPFVGRDPGKVMLSDAELSETHGGGKESKRMANG